MDNLSSRISNIKNKISEMMKAPFAGELAKERALMNKENELKKARYELLLLEKDSQTTTDSLERQSSAYEAWVTTIKEFIRSALTEGRSLGKDVSGIVTTFQTQLLGVSDFSSGKDKTSAEERRVEDLEREYQILQAQYELTYGTMRDELEMWSKEQDASGQRLYSSVSEVEQAITGQKNKLDELEDSYSSWQKKSDDIAEALFNVKMETFAIENEMPLLAESGQAAYDILIESSDDYLKKLEKIYYKELKIIELKKGRREANAQSEVNVEMGVTDKMLTGSETARDWLRRTGRYDGRSVDDLVFSPGNVENDFVSRPGQSPVSFSPQDTIVGVKNTAALGATNISFGNITINGGQNMTAVDIQTVLARTIQKELATIRAR